LINAAQFGMAELSWLSGMFVCLDGNVINDVSGITMSPFLKIYRRPPDLQMPGRHPNSNLDTSGTAATDAMRVAA
jgi:hypothetical protein